MYIQIGILLVVLPLVANPDPPSDAHTGLSRHFCFLSHNMALSVEDISKKKAKIDYLGMLNEGLWVSVLEFSNLTELVRWKRTSKTCCLHSSNEQLLKSIRESLFRLCGHDLKVGKTKVSLESLAFYEAVVQEGILNRKTRFRNGHVPQAALRVQRLFAILEDFPNVKAGWEVISGQFNDFGDGVKAKWNVGNADPDAELSMVGVLVHFMQQEAIIPSGGIDVSEHVAIVVGLGSRKYQHPLYRQYMTTFSSNLFQSGVPMAVRNEEWATAHLYVKYLVCLPPPRNGRRYRH